jgi:hypothetical protein
MSRSCVAGCERLSAHPPLAPPSELDPTRTAASADGHTFDQEPENQLQELRAFVAARGWTGVEFVDRGVSGAKDRRPALDTPLREAKRRRFDVLVCWRLDRQVRPRGGGGYASKTSQCSGGPHAVNIQEPA